MGGICYCSMTESIFVADCGNARVSVFSSSSFEFTSSFRAPGLSQPYGVAVTATGDLLAVTDYDTNYCHVIKICSSGASSVTAVSMSGQGDSVRLPVTFYAPSGVAFAYQDTLIIVCDTFHDRLVTLDAATLQLLWVQSVPRALNPTSLLVVGDNIIVLMSKRNGGFGTKCSIFQHPVCPSDASAEHWTLLHDNIDNDNATGGLTHWDST